MQTKTLYNVDMAETLGTLEQATLLSVWRLGKHAYGRTVVLELEARLGRRISAGAAYATLARLEERGLLSSRLESGAPTRGGRVRRFYTVEKSGLTALQQAHCVAKSIWKGIALPLRGRL